MGRPPAGGAYAGGRGPRPGRQRHGRGRRRRPRGTRRVAEFARDFRSCESCRQPIRMRTLATARAPHTTALARTRAHMCTHQAVCLSVCLHCRGGNHDGPFKLSQRQSRPRALGCVGPGFRPSASAVAAREVAGGGLERKGLSVTGSAHLHSRAGAVSGRSAGAVCESRAGLSGLGQWLLAKRRKVW